jgi:N-acetylmuramoyl-L-alanine amidase
MPKLTIKDGWVVGVKRKTTTKQGGHMIPRGIVMHYTAGWTTNGDVATLSTSDRKASVQFVVGRDGELVQIVSCDRVAWHAGPSKYKGMVGLTNSFIGIEICNAGWIKKLSNGNYIDQYSQQISPEGHFIGQNRKTHTPPKDWHVEYHPRLAKGTYAWEPFYPEQLDVVDELVAAILRAYPTIKHIVSHEEIDTRGWKTDPGPMFSMRRYTKMLEDRSADSVLPKPAVPLPSPPGLVMPPPRGIPFPSPTVEPEPVPVPAPVPAPAPAPAPVPEASGHVVYTVSEPVFLREYEDGYLNNRVVLPRHRVHVRDVGGVDGSWSLIYGVNPLDGVEGWIRTNLLKKE